MWKNVLELTHEEAKEFFLKDSAYHTFFLPDYFDFSNLLMEINNKIWVCEDLVGFLNNWKNPKNHDWVNYYLRHNKDSKYAWRKFELIHPVIYVALVSLITTNENWTYLVNRFNELKAYSKIKNFSMPIVTEDLECKREDQIKLRITEIEKKSIALSLDFKYLLNTDIVDCYWSIYTHSISRAIHGKERSKLHRRFEDGIWNKIDNYIQYMHYWQTNWIPQWSVLMDFIAECVLLYIDTEFTKKLEDSGINENNYNILRHRDDYRIFVNTPKEWEIIIKILSEVLSEFWMRINTEKTKSSWNVIYDSMKIDKLNYMFKYKHKKNILQELIWINKFSDEYPCSWTLIKLLGKVSKKVDKWTYTNENIDVIIAVLVDIAYKNLNTYQPISLILSKFLWFLDDNQRTLDLITKIIAKFEDRPNTEILDLRLQRITYFIDPEREYNWKLYKALLVSENQIWNVEWLNEELENIVKNESIIDRTKVENKNSIISIDELDDFMLQSMLSS